MPAFFIALGLLLLLFTAVPLLITLIYKIFYDRHLNKSFQSERPLRTWVSPLIVFLILFLTEFLLMVAAGLFFKADTSKGASALIEEDEFIDTDYDIMLQSEIDQSILSSMNGKEVKGFQMTDYSKGDISCQVYKRSSDDLLPSFVIRYSYTGDKKIASFDTGLVLNNQSLSSLSDLPENEAAAVYLILSDQIDPDSLKNFLSNVNFYDQAMDDYDTGNLGTYNPPQPAAELSITIK